MIISLLDSAQYLKPFMFLIQNLPSVSLTILSMSPLDKELGWHFSLVLKRSFLTFESGNGTYILFTYQSDDIFKAYNNQVLS